MADMKLLDMRCGDAPSAVSLSTKVCSSITAQLRKIKKPMIERRRRERINECLTQLKSLVLDAMNKDESRFSKMEKADILEMTVAHLKSSRRQSCIVDSPPEVEQKYVAGFHHCVQEVGSYLSETDLNNNVKVPLLKHLDACLQHVFPPELVNPPPSNLPSLKNNRNQNAHQFVRSPSSEPSSSSDIAPSTTEMPCSSPIQGYVSSNVLDISVIAVEQICGNRVNLERKSHMTNEIQFPSKADYSKTGSHSSSINDNCCNVRSAQSVLSQTSSHAQHHTYPLHHQTTFRHNHFRPDVIAKREVHCCSPAIKTVFPQSVLNSEGLLILDINPVLFGTRVQSNVWRPW